MGNATGLEAPNLLTVREIRDIFGVSRSTVYRWIDQEKFSKVGKVNGLEDYQRQKVLLLEPLDPGLIEEIQAWMKKRSKSKKPLFLAQKLARSAIGQIPIEPIDQDHHDEKKLSKEIQALLAELSEEREARNRFLQELELAAQDLKQGANISEEAQLTKILTSLDKIRQSELELLRETETLVPNQAGFSPPSQLTEKGTKAFQEDREEPLPSEPGPGEEAGVQEAEEEGTPREAPKGQRDGENPDDLGERSSSEGGEAPGELEVLEEQDLSRDQELPQEETSGEESPRKGQREECILEKAEGDEDLLTIEMSADDLPAWLDSPEPPQNPDHGITQEEEEDLEDSFLGEEEPPNTFTPEEEEAADPKDFDEPAPALESEEIQEDLAASFLGEEPGAEPHVKAQEKAQEETNRAEESARSLAMLFGVSLEDPATEAPGNEEEAVEVQEDEVGGSQDPDTQDLTTPDLKDQEEAPQEPEQQENSLASLFGLNPETGRPLQEKQSGETIPQKAPSSQGQEPEEGQGKGIAMVFDTTPSAEEESEASTESANEIAMVFDASEEPDQKEEPKEKKEEEQSQDSIAMVFGAPGQEQEKKEEQKNAQAEEQSQDSIAMVFGAPGQEQEKKEEQKDAQAEEQSQDSIAMVFGAPGQEQEKKEEQKDAQAEEQSQDSIAMVFGAPGQEQEKKEEPRSEKEDVPAEVFEGPANSQPSGEVPGPQGPTRGADSMAVGLAEIRGPVTEIAQHTKEVAESLNRLTETAQGAAQEFRKKLDQNRSIGKTLVTLGLFTLGLCWFLAMVLKPFLGGLGFYFLLAANLAASVTVLVGRKKIIESGSNREE